MSFGEHVVVTTQMRVKVLCRWSVAPVLWECLSRAVPDADAAVLMPDHIHLAGPVGSAVRLRPALRSFTRKTGVALGEPHVEPITTRKIGFRTLRYIWENPRRAGLVRDPWEWIWTTFRDIGSCTHQIWTQQERVFDRLGLGASTPLELLLRSADFSPSPLLHRLPTSASLSAVVAAAASALRRSPGEVLESVMGKRVLVQMVEAVGVHDFEALRATLGISRTTHWRYRNAEEAALTPALRCLADLRLHALAQSETRRFTRGLLLPKRAAR